MITAIAIVVTDVLLFLVFVSQYRQELGMTVSGAHDTPPIRKPRPRTAPPTRPGRQIARR